MSARFADSDPIEDEMGVLVIDMTQWQIVSYLQTCMAATFGIHLAAAGTEHYIFKNLQKTYGREIAGLIVKWTIWRYHGRPDGEYLRFTSFTKPRKWWTDAMANEAQAQLAIEFAPASTGGMVSSARLL